MNNRYRKDKGVYVLFFLIKIYKLTCIACDIRLINLWLPKVLYYFSEVFQINTNFFVIGNVEFCCDSITLLWDLFWDIFDFFIIYFIILFIFKPQLPTFDIFYYFNSCWECGKKYLLKSYIPANKNKISCCLYLHFLLDAFYFFFFF